MKKKAVLIMSVMLIGVVAVMAARFEDLTVGKLRVENVATFEKPIVSSGTQTNSDLVVTGTLLVNGVVTQEATPVFTQAAVAAATNAATAGFTVTINGTNYVVKLYPN